VQRLAGSSAEPIAGGGQAGFSGDGGPAAAALLDTPTSVAQDSRGNVFVTELAGRIRRIDAASGTITTVAGGGSGGDGGPATAAALNQPHGIAVGSDGTLFFAETPAGRLRRIAPDGTISTLARDLALPVDVAIGPDGRVYVALYGANRIVRVDRAGTVTQVATATGPDGVAIGADGTIYATERGRPWVLRIDPVTGAVTRLGG
jgi:streptogramin lyase